MLNVIVIAQVLWAFKIFCFLNFILFLLFIYYLLLLLLWSSGQQQDTGLPLPFI